MCDTRRDLPPSDMLRLRLAPETEDQAMNIQNQSAVVTGAGSGIGQAVAIELAGRGAKAVCLVDRS